MAKTNSLATLESKAPELGELLRLLANEQRLRMLWRLGTSGGELTVAALSEGCAGSPSALSQHLTKLRIGGLIDAHRVVRKRVYRTADAKAMQLAMGLFSIFCKMNDAHFVRPSSFADETYRMIWCISIDPPQC